MIKNIFLGQAGGDAAVVIEGPITPKGNSIVLHTPDMSALTGTKKLDVLYYNSINRYGEVLRSLVYVSDIRDIDDTTEIVYTPAELMNNTDLEKDMVLTNPEVNNWLNDTITQTGSTLLNNRSYKKTHTYSKFNLATDYAPMVSDNKYMYDGWYTLASIVPEVHADNGSGVLAGTLRDNSGIIEYAAIDSPSAGDWNTLDNINTSVSMFKLEAQYTSKDFFIVLNTNTLYHNLLSKKIDNEWFTGIGSIKPKVRSIYSNAENQSFEVCQHLINSINLTLLSIIT